jgi:2-oxoglutarate dehydrogenase E2 component (dihydrolipoamide succinyltransferase)
MATEIRVPALGESVTEATVGRWFKKAGEPVKADEPIVELETDKVTLEVNAPAPGVLAEIVVKDGETVSAGALLGQIGDAASPAPPKAEAKPGPRPTAPPASALAPAPATLSPLAMPASPAAAKIAADHGLDPAAVEGSGKRGQVLKGDVLDYVAPPPALAPAAPPPSPAPASEEEREERVPMTRLRQTIARRLKDAQNTAAMLTTFNEADMTEVMALRARYKDAFEQKHGVKLGFMGFFVKACAGALREVPSVNAEIDGADIIYKNYYHLGVAVGTDKGLVVPVVRDCDRLDLAGIEKTIADLGKRARAGELKIEEMQGGTFTITNGGVYGSLMSTPILNVPQSGILGMHKIQERPVAVAGKIEVRPMMYLALTYDHRIVDGKEAVTFLVRVKEALEDPARLMLDL